MITHTKIHKRTWDFYVVFDNKDVAICDFTTGAICLLKDVPSSRFDDPSQFGPITELYALLNTGETITQGQAFYLQRDIDISGVSGTGFVAYGYQFPLSTKVVLHWTESGNFDVEYQGLEGVKRIHGHNGATKIVLLAEKEIVHG